MRSTLHRSDDMDCTVNGHIGPFPVGDEVSSSPPRSKRALSAILEAFDI